MSDINDICEIKIMGKNIKKIIRSSGGDCFLFEYLTLSSREKSAGHTSDSWLLQSSILNIFGSQLRSMHSPPYHTPTSYPSLLPSFVSQHRVEHLAGRPFPYSQGRPLFLSCPWNRSWSPRSSGTAPVCSVSLVVDSACFYWAFCCSELLRERGEDRGGELEP